MDYIAHLTEDKRVQKLVDHCENTAKLTGNFAAVFDEEKIGYQTGLLHPHGVRGLKSAQCHKASPYIGTRHYPFWILDFLQSLLNRNCRTIL